MEFDDLGSHTSSMASEPFPQHPRMIYGDLASHMPRSSFAPPLTLHVEAPVAIPTLPGMTSLPTIDLRPPSPPVQSHAPLTITSLTGHEERERQHHERWDQFELLRERLLEAPTPETAAQLSRCDAVVRSTLPQPFLPNYAKLFYQPPEGTPEKGLAGTPTGHMLTFFSRKAFVETMRNFLPLSPKFDTNNGTFKLRFKVHRSTSPTYKGIRAKLVEDGYTSTSDLLVVEVKYPKSYRRGPIQKRERPTISTTSFELDQETQVNPKRASTGLDSMMAMVDTAGPVRLDGPTITGLANPLDPGSLATTYVIPGGDEAGRRQLQGAVGLMPDGDEEVFTLDGNSLPPLLHIL